MTNINKRKKTDVCFNPDKEGVEGETRIIADTVNVYHGAESYRKNTQTK